MNMQSAHIEETNNTSQTVSVRIHGMDKDAVVAALWEYIRKFPVAQYRTKYDAKVQSYSDIKGNDLGFVTFLLRYVEPNPAPKVSISERAEGWKVIVTVTGDTKEDVEKYVCEYFLRYAPAGYGTYHHAIVKQTAWTTTIVRSRSSD